jgi:hypothetical protein
LGEKDERFGIGSGSPLAGHRVLMVTGEGPGVRASRNGIALFLPKFLTFLVQVAAEQGPCGFFGHFAVLISPLDPPMSWIRSGAFFEKNAPYRPIRESI